MKLRTAFIINKGHHWKSCTFGFLPSPLDNKPDGDALQDLSLDNYYVMRDYVADPDFLLQKKIEAKLSERHPDKWMPLYSQVTFSHIRYSDAYKQGKKQDKIMKDILKNPKIEELWDSEEIENEILAKLWLKK